MKANIGTVDRVVRVIVGLVIIGVGIYFRSWWGLIGLLPAADGGGALLPGLRAVRHQHLQDRGAEAADTAGRPETGLRFPVTPPARGGRSRPRCARRAGCARRRSPCTARSAMRSSTSSPFTTSPKAVYCRSRKRASPWQMKNWLPAESGCAERAMERTPRTCGLALNSALSFQPGPPVPGDARGAGLGVGAAALDHEALDDAVKRRAVVEAVAGELLEVLDGLGRDVGPEGHGHFTIGGLDDGVFGGCGRSAHEGAARRRDRAASGKCRRATLNPRFRLHSVAQSSACAM